MHRTINMVRFALVFAVISTLQLAAAQAETWAEKLGFPAGSKVLMLHCDDIGMCYEANYAAKHYMTTNKYVLSSAMMVPCPWFNEIAAWYRENPEHCMGLHLAMNSEWKHYRWPPVAPASEVPGMVDDKGYLWQSTLQTALSASAKEVETEIRAQIERALAAGIRPTHIDTHMGTLYARPDYTEAFFRLAEEYEIPANVIEVTPYTTEKYRKRGIRELDRLAELIKAYKLPRLDDFDAVPNGDTYDEKLENFFTLVRDLRPGITEIIFHPSQETEGLKHITNSWQQRSWEARMFDDPTVHRFFEREGIHFTSWVDIMDRWRQRQQASASP